MPAITFIHGGPAFRSHAQLQHSNHSQSHWQSATEPSRGLSLMQWTHAMAGEGGRRGALEGAPLTMPSVQRTKPGTGWGTWRWVAVVEWVEHNSPVGQ